VTGEKTPRRHPGQRFVVRWHMSLILAGVVLAGVGASRALLALGVRSVPLRWLLVLVFGYLVFFVLVRLWTVIPFAVVGVITVGAGWLVQWWCPEAVRLADAFTRCPR
jgi:hypothetical protein